MNKFYLLVTLLGLMIAGCAGENEIPPTERETGPDLQPSAGNPLPGTAWKLISLGSGSPAYPDVIHIEFTEDQISGNASCNTFSGSYTAEDVSIEFGPMAMTLMACADEGLMDQEQAFMEMLGKVTGFEIERGRLQMFDGEGAFLYFEPVE